MLPREELLTELTTLNLEELEGLLDWLKQHIKSRKQELPPFSVPLKKGREVIETYSTDKITYRLEKVKCGKKKCKCSKGKLHGPYWYAYTWDKKRLKSTYIGKTLPALEAQQLSTPASEQLSQDLAEHSESTQD